MTDLIYIAGPLNAMACDYIKNLNAMFTSAWNVEENGAAVIIPGNDVVYGVWHGKRDYHHYWQNNVEALKRCNAMFLSPGHEHSKGVTKEKIIARSYGIPIFDNINDLSIFLNRPKILAIVGESGTGKTTAAEYIERRFNIPMVKSYTDREPRPGDTSHTFLTKEEFNDIPFEDMIVYTEFGGNRYCCQHKDIEQPISLNTYVIDERGYMELLLKYKSQYRVEGFRIYRDEQDRIDTVGGGRVERDRHKFVLPVSCYEHVYINDGYIEDLEEFLDAIVEGFKDGK